MADQQPEDQKPDHINIRVVSPVIQLCRFTLIFQDKGEVYFKIRKSTPLMKLMNAYCEKQGISYGTARFTFDDKRLDPKQTAEQVLLFQLSILLIRLKAGLENDDLIEVLNEQVGGHQ